MILEIFRIGQNGSQKDRLIPGQALRSFTKIMFGRRFNAVNIVPELDRIRGQYLRR